MRETDKEKENRLPPRLPQSRALKCLDMSSQHLHLTSSTFIKPLTIDRKRPYLTYSLFIKKRHFSTAEEREPSLYFISTIPPCHYLTPFL